MEIVVVNSSPSPLYLRDKDIKHCTHIASAPETNIIMLPSSRQGSYANPLHKY